MIWFDGRGSAGRKKQFRHARKLREKSLPAVLRGGCCFGDQLAGLG